MNDSEHGVHESRRKYLGTTKRHRYIHEYILYRLTLLAYTANQFRQILGMMNIRNREP